MKFTVDTDIKQIQLEKEISVEDLQLLLTTLSAALKDINLYTIAVRSPVKEYIWQPWYVPAQPLYNDPNVFKIHYDMIWCSVDSINTDGTVSGSFFNVVNTGGNTVSIGNALAAEVAVPSGL